MWYRLREIGSISQVVFAAKWDEWGDWYPPRGDGGRGSTTTENVMRDYDEFPDLLLSASNGHILTKADVAQLLVVQPRTLPGIESAIAEPMTG